MIHAVGIDVVDIDRFDKILSRWGDRFSRRILTGKEIEYCAGKANGSHSMAVRFAAKEAMIKCLPAAKSLSFHWHEMEILNDRDGGPQVFLYGGLKNMLKGTNILISLSHSASSAVAMIVIEQKQQDLSA